MTLRTAVEKVTAVRIDHQYTLKRDGTLLAEAKSTLACIGRDGRPQALPDILRHPQPPRG